MTKNVQVKPVTMIFVGALVAAGAYAAGRSTSSPATAPVAVAETTSQAADPSLPPGHPPMTGHGGSASGLPTGHPVPADTELSWKAPARWKPFPSTSTMRLATYRIPHAPGDAEDAEMSVMQAGGTVDANAKRWVDQFDAAGQKTAKRTTRKVSGLDVTIVEVEGTYSGGMGKDAREEPGWALVGVIVATPGMPHFFKLTGPSGTVKSARVELDELVGSFVAR